MSVQDGHTWSQRFMVGYWDPRFRGRSRSHISKLVKQWTALGQWPPRGVEWGTAAAAPKLAATILYPEMSAQWEP